MKTKVNNIYLAGGLALCSMGQQVGGCAMIPACTWHTNTCRSPEHVLSPSRSGGSLHSNDRQYCSANMLTKTSKCVPSAIHVYGLLYLLLLLSLHLIVLDPFLRTCSCCFHPAVPAAQLGYNYLCNVGAFPQKFPMSQGVCLLCGYSYKLIMNIVRVGEVLGGVLSSHFIFRLSVIFITVVQEGSMTAWKAILR